jgi:hypothetical protein
MMHQWQLKPIIIDINPEYDQEQRQAIADEVIDFIVNRSKQGLDKYNRSFPNYSKSYKDSLDFKIAGKSSSVDLTLSGDMLDSIELLSNRKGSITIGFRPGSENDKAEGNIIGSYGQPSGNPAKSRDFLGIHPSDLSSILNKYPLSKETITIENKALQAILERLGIVATIKSS